MRAVVQRVSSSSVTVNNEIIGAINRGFMVLLGIEEHDTEKDMAYIVDKVSNLRVFEDEDGKMNRSLIDVHGELLVVSQFTLYGDCRKGRRPSFITAAKPDLAIPLYEKAVTAFKEKGIKVETGEFGAHMDVEIMNDGPVTLLLDSRKDF